MARGRDLHDARVAAVNALGRTLSRRARSKCELCEEQTSLQVIEILPLPEEPDTDSALMLCERCRGLLDARRLPRADELRFLEGMVWSEIAPVQISAVRLLRRLAAEQQTAWARDCLDGLWLPEEIQERVDA